MPRGAHRAAERRQLGLHEDAFVLEAHLVRPTADLPAGEVEVPGGRPADPGAEAEVDVAEGALVLEDAAGRGRDAGVEAERNMGDAVEGRVVALVEPAPAACAPRARR